MRHGPSVERPLIGITTAEIINAALPHAPYALAQTHPYSHYVEEAGGSPLHVPIPKNINSGVLEATIASLEGLVLAGGNDVDPELYGQRASELTEDVSHQRDAAELQSIKIAEQLGIPVLAICRGMQLLNVYRGGTLHSHIPGLKAVKEGGIDHQNAGTTLEPSRDGRHLVSLDKSSRLGGWLLAHAESDKLEVNSWHHQAIDKLGTGLIVVGQAPDGIIEAVESTRPNELIVGVQWHPEAMADQQLELMRRFIEACRQRRAQPLIQAA